MRYPDWNARLSHYVKAQTRRPLKYGSHDRFTFVAGAIGAMTGTDPATGLRGKYSSLATMNRMFERLGHSGLVAFLAQGLTEVPRSFAQSGDLAVFADHDLCGVVNGAAALVMGDVLSHVPLALATHVYGVR